MTPEGWSRFLLKVGAGSAFLAACTASDRVPTVSPLEAADNPQKTQDHFIMEGKLDLLSPEALRTQINEALKKKGVMAEISLVAPADALTVTTAKDNEGGVVSQVAAVVTNSDGTQNNTLLVCQKEKEQDVQSCSFFDFSNSSTSAVVENKTDGSTTQSVSFPILAISEKGLSEATSPYDLGDRYAVTFSVNPADSAINADGAQGVEIMKDGVLTQAKVEQGGDLANWWEKFLLASLETSQNVSLPVAGEILPTETVTPTPTFTVTPTPEPTPTVEPTKVLIDEHDMEIHYEDRMENQEFMGVKFNGSVIVDKSISRQIDKVTIEDNVHAEFLARTIFGVWWDKGNVDHEGLPTEDDFKAFMAQWAKAQQTNDPGDWEAVQLTDIWANNLEDGNGYVQEPIVIWPMCNLESAVVPRGVLAMKQMNHTLVKKDRMKNITLWTNRNIERGIGANYEKNILHMYFGILDNYLSNPKDYPMVEAFSGSFSGTSWWLKINKGKGISASYSGSKQISELLVKGLRVYFP